jgi:hypothetical protein
MPYKLRYPPGYDFILETEPVWIGMILMIILSYMTLLLFLIKL